MFRFFRTFTAPLSIARTTGAAARSSILFVTALCNVAPGTASAQTNDPALKACWEVTNDQDRLLCFSRLAADPSRHAEGATDVDCTKDSNGQIAKAIAVKARDVVTFPEKFVCRPVIIDNFACMHVKGNLFYCDTLGSPVLKIAFRVITPSTEMDALRKDCEQVSKVGGKACRRTLEIVFNTYDTALYRSEGRDVRFMRTPIVRSVGSTRGAVR